MYGYLLKTIYRYLCNRSLRKAGKAQIKNIRFHDLRHSCASVLLAGGVPIKQIHEWLGHSDMSTTANIYSHLDAVTKADYTVKVTN